MYGWHCRENCCSRQLLKEQEKKRSSSFQTVPLWLLPLWLSASVLLLVMGPHLRNERFFHWLYCWVGNCQFVVVVLSVFCLSVGVYRSTGTWSLPHHHPTSSALHVLVYICIVSTVLTVCYDSTYFLLPHLSSSGTVDLVPEACRIFNTYPALFRILCSSGLLFSISLSWILFFLPLVIAVVWNIRCCRTFTPSSALFNFSSSALFMFNLSSVLLMWRLLSVFVASGAVGQDPEVCRTITLLPALFRPSSSSSFTCCLFSGLDFFILMPFIADELRLDSGACRTSTLFQRSSGLFVYLLYHSITLLCYIVLFLVSSFRLVCGQYSSLYFGCRV